MKHSGNLRVDEIKEHTALLRGVLYKLPSGWMRSMAIGQLDTAELWAIEALKASE